MIRFALAFSALTLAAPVQAAVVTFDYQGVPLTCLVGDCTGVSLASWTGQLVIDESLLPGGTLRNTALAIGYASASADPAGVGGWQSIINTGGVNVRVNGILPGVVSASGTLAEIVSDTALLAQFFLSVDANYEITRAAATGISTEFGWREHEYWRDHASDGDLIRGTASAPVGRWTVTVGTTPAPVPLPASALLLGGALAALGLTGRRRAARLAPVDHHPA